MSVIYKLIELVVALIMTLFTSELLEDWHENLHQTLA